MKIVLYVEKVSRRITSLPINYEKLFCLYFPHIIKVLKSFENLFTICLWTLCSELYFYILILAKI